MNNIVYLYYLCKMFKKKKKNQIILSNSSSSKLDGPILFFIFLKK